MIKNRSIYFTLFVMTLTSISMNAQLLQNAKFRIYRAECILGTVTQLRFNPDSTYNMNIIEIDCSLCDHNKLEIAINKTGKWSQVKDTIIFDNKKKLIMLGDTIIRPLYVIGMNTDTILNEKQEKFFKGIIGSKFSDFHLVYDTYPNGIAKRIVDKYRMKRNEYEIEFELNGSIKELKYFWDNKQRKKIK